MNKLTKNLNLSLVYLRKFRLEKYWMRLGLWSSIVIKMLNKLN